MADTTIEKFWKPALAIGGVAAIGAFVFYSLYKQWLTLDIFSQLTPDHTFIIMIVFLVLVFIVAFTMLILWFLDKGRPKEQEIEEGMSFSIPENCSFEQAVRALASEDGSVVEFEGFTKAVLGITLNVQTIKATTTLRAIELLSSVAVSSIPKYRVSKLDGKYQIIKI
ncbi:MAG: hypothetical protein KME44_13245 [Candidatus Thiodiazotropha sp. (ex Lucina pensylvanica)]|nr:hypothetical protein [Candidatus Thiodiazotropha sp. (ex Lucina pensylvanica)]